jgi:Rrf2 family protein
MRISTKGRYGLAVMVLLAERNKQCLTAQDISGMLSVSKIYLEQVLALLRNAGLVQSVKGSQGGYFLTRRPDGITALEVLRATETPLFDAAEAACGSTGAHIASAIDATVWKVLDTAVADTLAAVTLQDIVSTGNGGQMFYI